MRSSITTIRIRIDQAIEIEKRGINLSEFVREKLDEELGSNDFIAAKEKELTEQLENLKKIRKESTDSNKGIISDEENKFLEGAKIRVQSMPGELAENCRVYNQKFGKRINPIKFKELLQ